MARLSRFDVGTVMILKGFTIGFVLALALTPLVRFLAGRYGVVDAPDADRKRHGRPMPLLGGMAVFAAFAAAVWLSRDGLFGGFLLPKHVVGILTGGTFLMIGGFLDDHYRLPPHVQLLFPSLAALAVIASGVGADVITNPLGGPPLRLDLWHWTVLEAGGVPYRLTLPADLFTFVWLMLMMYTTKLLDGLDGLVAGLGVVGCVVLAFLGLTPEIAQPELSRLAMIGAGALGGFLFYNARPASIFLGEGGSTFTGFLLGSLAILAGGKIGITLLVLAVPVMDVFWTVFRRSVLERTSWAQGDLGHLHFRLVAWGLTPGQTTLLFWLFAAAFGGAGLFLRGSREKLLAFAILAILFAAVTYLTRRRHGRNDPR